MRRKNGIEPFAAGVDVDRGGSVLGPSVDGEVGLGDQKHPGHTLRREAMEDLADDGRARRDRALTQSAGEAVSIRESGRGAAREVEQDVESEFFHQRYAHFDRFQRSVGSLEPWSRKARRVIATVWFILVGITLVLAEDPSPADSEFALRLSSPRVNCTATVTTGGRVLIAGGSAHQTSLGSALADAELLDPAWSEGIGRITGPIALSGKLFAARCFHDAVALDGGGVLLVGGDLPGSIEIFDPAAGARGEFKTGGPLLHGPRFGLTATRLEDGRVLIAGGLFANQKPTKKTEIYDPTTKKSIAGPDLTEARHSHTATLLQDGRVLITGGVGKKTTDLFDPKTQSIARGPDMLAYRDDHRATLLKNGTVLLAAGQDEKARVQRSCEVIDVRASRSIAVGSLGEARADHAQLLLNDGTVLVLGGEYDVGDDEDRILDSIERFDPRTEKFSTLGKLKIPRDDCVALQLDDGRVVVIGGQTTGDQALASIEFVRL